MSELASLDGAVGSAADAVIPATDDGLLRGDGVFEAVRVYDGRSYALDEHLDRMERSAENLRLEWPVPRAQLEAEAAGLIQERGGSAFDGVLRIVLTRGGRRLLLTEPLPVGPERPRLAYVTFAPSRILDGVKSLSYGANMQASRLARERGFDEALMITPHGRVLEAPTASVFWVSESGTVHTPPLEDHILASITRDRVLRVAEVEERPCSADDLEAAAEVFLASTTREVQPVAALEEREWPQAGERTLAARAALRSLIESELG